MKRRVVCCVAAAALVWSADAAAQGKGNAYGRAKNARPPASSSSTPPVSPPQAAGAPELQISGTGIRNFGSWLDDASTLPAGRGLVSLGIGMWKMPGYREVDLPMIDTAVGVHRQVQVGVSVPYYSAGVPGDPVARGFGTVYLNTKVQLREPPAGGAGWSVTPMLEILNLSPHTGSRVSWALPVNVELQRTGWRTYASTGYFSRGAVFASGALEKMVSSRVWLTGTISHSYSVREDPLSAALGLARSRTDIGSGVALALAPTTAVFASVGRTISTQDANSSTLVLAGGVSFNFDVR